MIIKGDRRGGAAQLAAHLLRLDTNEDVHIREIENYPASQLDSKNLRSALRLMEAQGTAKGKKRTLYHAIIAPQQGETLNQKQLEITVDTLAKNLGLSGHQRVIVEHKKAGRQHFHVVFNIIDPVTGKLARLQWTRKKQWNTARQLENELGLKPVNAKGRPARRWECERGKRSGIDPLKVRKEVTAIYKVSKTGKEFIANLAKAGYVLTRGRNNSYVLIDKAGDIHGLMRRIEGAKLKNLRRKFPDLKNIALPSLASVQKKLKAQRSGRNARASFHHARTYIKSRSTGGTAQGRATSKYAPLNRGSAVTEKILARADSQKSPERPSSGKHIKPRTGNAVPSGNKPNAPKITKSLALAAAHTAQWRELSARYSAKRATAQNEPDEMKRNAMLAEIERQEVVERAELEARQHLETNADLAAQQEFAERQQGNPQRPVPKP